MLECVAPPALVRPFLHRCRRAWSSIRTCAAQAGALGRPPSSAAAVPMCRPRRAPRRPAVAAHARCRRCRGRPAEQTIMRQPLTLHADDALPEVQRLRARRRRFPSARRHRIRRNARRQLYTHSPPPAALRRAARRAALRALGVGPPAGRPRAATLRCIDRRARGAGHGSDAAAPTAGTRTNMLVPFPRLRWSALRLLLIAAASWSRR